MVGLGYIECMSDLEFFKSKFRYDPDKGLVHYLYKTYGKGGIKSPGDVAGSISYGNSGHKRILLSIRSNGTQRVYKAHRVAWLLMTGEWPTMGIDHIDGDGTNNRWSNLRLSTQSQNLMNRAIQTNNTSGYKGVTRNGNRWHAQIWVKRKATNLGTYATKEEAYAARLEAEKRLHGEFARQPQPRSE